MKETTCILANASSVEWTKTGQIIRKGRLEHLLSRK